MCISDFSGKDFVLLASSLAIALSKEYTADELALLAGFFTALGDNLAILSFL